MTTKGRRIPVQAGLSYSEEWEKAAALEERLRYVSLRVRRATQRRQEVEDEIAIWTAERDRIVEALAEVWDPEGDAEFEEYDFEAAEGRSDDAGTRERLAETTVRADAIEEFMKERGPATFTEVLHELQRRFGQGITRNHAAAVLKRRRFVKLARGVYALSDSGERE